MNSHHGTQPLGRLSAGLHSSASRPRFALGQTLRVINKTARIPVGTEVRVTYWLPLRRDGTYHYFVTGPVTALAREGAWVHERDMEPAAVSAPIAPPPAISPIILPKHDTQTSTRTEMKLAALPEPTRMKLAQKNELSEAVNKMLRETNPDVPGKGERRKQWFQDWLSRGHIR